MEISSFSLFAEMLRRISLMVIGKATVDKMTAKLSEKQYSNYD